MGMGNQYKSVKRGNTNIENAYITLNDIATWQSQLTGCGGDLSGYVLEETPSTSAHISMGIAISIIFIILLIFHPRQEASALGCGGNYN